MKQHVHWRNASSQRSAGPWIAPESQASSTSLRGDSAIAATTAHGPVGLSAVACRTTEFV